MSVIAPRHRAADQWSLANCLGDSAGETRESSGWFRCRRPAGASFMFLNAD